MDDVVEALPAHAFLQGYLKGSGRHTKNGEEPPMSYDLYLVTPPPGFDALSYARTWFRHDADSTITPTTERAS